MTAGGDGGPCGVHSCRVGGQKSKGAFLGRQLVRNLNSSAIKIAPVKKYPPKHREKVSLLLALTELSETFYFPCV